MKEERMKILQMVEDGKINVEEAGKLLDALKTSPEFCDAEDFNDKLKEFCSNTENFLKSAGCKIGDFTKDMEPKLRKATKTIVAKTANIVEDLGKALAKCLNNLNECTDDECGCCCGEEEQKPECCDDCCDENKEN